MRLVWGVVDVRDLLDVRFSIPWPARIHGVDVPELRHAPRKFGRGGVARSRGDHGHDTGRGSCSVDGDQGR